MTALDSRGDMVTQQTGFDVTWRGYDQAQVQQYVQNVEKELQRRAAAASHAETLARRLHALHSENNDLRAKIDQICRSPIEPDALQERSRRMIQLTRDEAAEITARARAAAEETGAIAEEAANRLRERHERLLAELDTRREEMENEHRDLMLQARAQVETMTKRAEEHRQQLDQEAARQRRQAETQFEKALDFRRSEAARIIAERDATSRAHTETLVRDATEKAQRLMADAERQVDVLHDARTRVSTELRSCRKLLADALPLLNPLPDETAQGLPEQRRSLPSDSAVSGHNTSAPRTGTKIIRPQPAR
jgi:DivIVA domain-containing protein